MPKIKRTYHVLIQRYDPQCYCGIVLDNGKELILEVQTLSDDEPTVSIKERAEPQL